MKLKELPDGPRQIGIRAWCARLLVFGLAWGPWEPAAWAQLAAAYPDDAGIRDHPSVIYATGFDSPDWKASDFPVGTRWGYPGSTAPAWNADEAYSGSGSLRHRQVAGTRQPGGLTIMGFTGRNEIYMRWYRKYQTGYHWGCHSVKNNGVYAVADPSGVTVACVQPTGYDKFSFRVQDEMRSTSGGQPGAFFGALYSYHPHADNGGCGEWMIQNQNGIQYQEPGRWYCYEIYMRANNTGESNGILKMWVDGQLRGHYEGFEFRLTEDLKINQVYLWGGPGGGCDTPYTQDVWDDNLVLATEYIGPMLRASNDVRPAPPSNLRITSVP